MIRHSPIRLLLVAALALPLTGCLFRSHKVETHYTATKLLESTPAELISRLNTMAGQVQTLNATVDLDTSVGGAKKGRVTEYQEIRGYVLVKKPGEIRMIGLFPIVRNKAFDMVSDGKVFRLSIPTKNKFIVGRNDVITPNPKQPLENLRPQHIFDALLLRAVDPADEIAVVEDSTETVLDPRSKKPVEEPDYVVVIIRREENNWYLARKVEFSREDLLPHRQVVYDSTGQVATDARYDAFTDYDGIWFPSLIDIRRPREEYDITLHVLKLRLNGPLNPDQFELPQPPGSLLVRMDTPSDARSGDPLASPR